MHATTTNNTVQFLKALLKIITAGVGFGILLIVTVGNDKPISLTQTPHAHAGEEKVTMCPFVGGEQTKVVEFNEGIGWAGNVNTSKESVSLSSGVYEVSLYSYTTRSPENIGQDQPNEQWQIEFFHNDSIIQTSGISDDLADGVATATATTLVNTNLTLPQQVTHIRGHHAVHTPGDNPANSLTAGCASFKKIETNQSPTAVDDTATTTEGNPVTIDVTDNDTDPDGDSLTVTSFTQPSDGIAATSSGQITYTPDNGFSGHDSFEYTITDGNGGTDTADVHVVTEKEPQSKSNGSIRVCKTVSNQDGDIVDGSNNSGSFVVDIFEDKDMQHKIKTVQFQTPLQYTADELTTNGSENDVVCETIDELEVDAGGYYYSEEIVNGSDWETPQYNDQISTPADALGDFFTYNGQLFDNDASNDSQRNQNADGHIVLTENRPDRTLILKNTYQSSQNDGFVCGDLAGENGWYGEYFNYSESHPDMELPQNKWGVDNGDPLSDETGWQGDWYQQQYFDFARVDGNLQFGDNFFPFGEGDYHFGTHWQAQVTADSAGSYPYTLTSDDDAWVYVDGDLRADNSGVHSPKTKNGSLSLSSGTHHVQVFFAERHTVQSHLHFEFTGDTENLHLIPFAPQCQQDKNRAPTAEDDSATTTNNTAIDIDVLANDTDPDGDSLAITDLTQPSAGSAATTTGNTITYTPDAGFVGTTTFTYTINDGHGESDTATVTVTDHSGAENVLTLVSSKVVCDEESQLPNWNGSNRTIDANTAQSWVSAHEGCELASGWEFQWNRGSASNPGDNQGLVDSWNTFGPTDEDGFATTSLTESDITSISKIWVREGLKENFVGFSGIGGSDNSAEMWCHDDVVNYDNYDFVRNPDVEETYHCVAFNAPTEQPPQDTDPQANDDTASTTEDTAVDIDVLTNDTDADGDVLTIIDVSSSSNGTTATTSTAGEIRYTPNDTFIGQDTFDYTIEDEDNATSSATVTITVNESDNGGGGGEKSECSDGVDNDGDGAIDREDDGCHTDKNADDGDDTYNPDDNSEEEMPECNDAADNDGDMKVDREDDGCHTDGDADDGDMTYDTNDNSENQRPSINIIGTNPQEITKGNTYNDPGATASDPEDGNITNQIAASSSVNTSKVGTYTVTYNVTDSNGATAPEKNRTVTVVSDADNGGGSGGSGGGGGGFSLRISEEDVAESENDDNAVVTWKTNTDATSRVVYGTTSLSNAEVDVDQVNYGYPYSTNEKEDEVESHSMEIDELDTSQTYYFRPVSDTIFTGEEVGAEVMLQFGQVAGVQTPQTTAAPAATSCSPYLQDNLKRGWDNDELEVLKLQAFLKTIEGFDSVEISGEFDNQTFNAVKQFQERYSDDVLEPWGYQPDASTGFVYITTRTKINEILCNTEIPFTSDEMQEMQQFRQVTAGNSADTSVTADGRAALGVDDQPGAADGRISAAPATTSKTAETATGTRDEIARNEDAVRSPMASVAAGVYTALNGPIETFSDALLSPSAVYLLAILFLISILAYIFLADQSTKTEET